MTDAKKELVQHHFDFGHEDVKKITTHQRIFTNKVSIEESLLLMFIDADQRSKETFAYIS